LFALLAVPAFLAFNVSLASFTSLAPSASLASFAPLGSIALIFVLTAGTFTDVVFQRLPVLRLPLPLHSSRPQGQGEARA
jgi:hypothetical protein